TESARPASSATVGILPHLLVCILGSPPDVDEYQILFIHLRERQSTSRETGRGEGEADSPLSREPDVGLNPRTLGP
uniref:Uncharacterized protein n=1 Tax=Mustela putorius furo TaxID=9669 RepID=M3XYM3_MUSPF